MVQNNLLKTIIFSFIMLLLQAGCSQESLTNTSDNHVSQSNDVPNSSKIDKSPTLTPSSSSTTSQEPVYTKDQLEKDPRAPSKDPADYNANGEFVPKGGVSKNPADYNAQGEYKPVDQMSKEEIKKELEDMLGKSLGQ